ncbi:MAG: RNA 2',3'-cyclic phosphodiesterase [Acidiferrobacteraceae bacterium]
MVTEHHIFFTLRPEIPLELALVWEAAHARGWRTVPIENAHVTLVFVGKVDDHGLKRVADRAALVAGERFTLYLDRPGCWHRTQVLWLAPSRPPAALGALEKGLRDSLGRAGFALPESTYCPHLTVSRHATSSQGFHPPAIVWEARRFFLMESYPGPEGVRYRPLREFALS